MSEYSKEIVRLVTEEMAKPTAQHRKVLEPLLNMVASIMAGIKHEHGVDDMVVVKGQLDRFYEKYLQAYAEQKIDTPESQGRH